MLTFLKSERTIDYLRWIAAFVAVVLTYGGAAWMVLRPAGWQLDTNGPLVEINLRDVPQPPAVPPSDRASEPAIAADPTGDNAQRALSDSADTAPRVAGASASRADADRDADTDAKNGSPDAPKAAAFDTAENLSITQPRSSADVAAQAPPKTEAPAVDSGGGGRPTTIPPRVVTPDTSTAASIARTPVDTSITVNQGRSLLRGAKGRSQFSVLPLPLLTLTPPLATLKDRNEPFAKKPSPVAGLTIGPAAPIANHGPTQDLVHKPAMGDDGGLARNAIGAVIARHTVMPQASTPLGVHALPGATLIALHAAGQHGPATTAAGAPLAATNAKPSEAAVSTGAASEQARHPTFVASTGGPAVNGTGMARPALSTGAIGGPAKAATGGLNGSSFRTKYP
jgi:hypothetical protein